MKKSNGLTTARSATRPDRDGQVVGPLREHQPGHEVAERVLLPVDEVVGRLDRQRIGLDLGPRVRRRPQPDHVRMDGHKTVEAIRRAVLQRHLDSHADPFTKV